MNSEVISSRYAKALLSLTAETGSGDKVYSQAVALVQIMQKVSQLKEFILGHDITLENKIQLLSTAIDEPLSEDLEKFVSLVSSRRRMDMFDAMLMSFISRYRQANGIRTGRLITAMPDGQLTKNLEDILSNRTAGKVQLESEVNPDLLGGFVFELDGYRMDASVRTRLEKIRQCLIDDSSRIV